MSFCGFANGMGDEGEEVGAAIEISQFSGFLNETLHGGECDGGVDVWRHGRSGRWVNESTVAVGW